MNTLNSVRDLYDRHEVWSKTAKRLLKPILRPKVNWESDIKNFLEEFASVESQYGFITPHDEPFREFLLRLTNYLEIRKMIETDELDAMAKVIDGANTPLEWSSEQAMAFFLKACFEIARKKPELSRIINLEELLKHVRTVDELISYPLNTQLPLYDAHEFPHSLGTFGCASTVSIYYRPDDYSALRKAAFAIPEYHYVLSNHYGDTQYTNAIVRISVKYPKLDEAFTQLSRPSRDQQTEPYFVDHFHFYCNELK